MTSRTRLGAAVLSVLVLSASPALAHHVMDGQMPTTFLQGLLSGIGHPIIGLDHLAFVVALGIAAAGLPGPFAVIAAFIVMSMAGVLVHLAQMDVPLVEPLVAFTVVLAGLALVLLRNAGSGLWLALAAIAGLLHGYAFGESIVGAERTVLGAYLLGIALVTAAIAVAVMQITRRIAGTEGAASPHLRAAGAVLGCVGAALLVGTLISG
jgi:urease accessory protein